MNERQFDTTNGTHRPDANALSENGQCAGLARGAAILVIDDNDDVARAMEIACRIAGHRVEAARSPQEALSRLAMERFDGILLDLNFSPGQTDGREGLALLARILAAAPDARVVVITAHSGVRVAVAAMQAGASDFVMKPWRNAELIAKIEAAIARPSRLASPARKPAQTAGDPVHILGESPAIERVRALVQRIGPTEASVAVTGPAGSGRGLVATALHAASTRADGAPAVVDLADAAAWEKLENGDTTLVLRHADRLDTVMQGRLLARLAPGARVVAILDQATGLSAPLRARIATIEIAVPPLADRGGDVLLLARHFARIAALRHGGPAPRFTPAAEALLTRRAWPDEVRGLALAVERAVLLADDGVIEAAAITPPATAASAPDPVARFDLADSERAMIVAALREHRHNVTHAAAALGLTRGALYRRMERHGL
jgi:DNA-binding NtrC family response regulator